MDVDINKLLTQAKLVLTPEEQQTLQLGKVLDLFASLGNPCDSIPHTSHTSPLRKDVVTEEATVLDNMNRDTGYFEIPLVVNDES